MSLKSLGKAILPPFVLSAYRHLCGQTSNDWKGNYSHWQEAVAMSLGYDTDEIFQKVLSASRRVRDGDALWERDSVCFFHEEYNWPLLACLLFVASHNNNALHVLDFGGALGSTYMQHRKALSGLKECSWNIVEQEHFVQCGKQEFQTETLRFFESMEDCLAQCHIILILFSFLACFHTLKIHMTCWFGLPNHPALFSLTGRLFRSAEREYVFRKFQIQFIKRVIPVVF